MKRALVLTAALVALAALLARPLPWPARWLEDVHPLLGAAPPDSFAREPDRDPWLDFRGKAFARARTKPRLLVVGGAGAAALAPRLEAALPAVEVVLAARAGYGVAQEAILVGRFAKALAVTEVVALDGDEPARLALGWTAEWDGERAAQRAPLGELLARQVGLVPAPLVPPLAPGAPGDLADRLARGRALVLALARAQGLAVLQGDAKDAEALLRRVVDAPR